MFNNDDATFTLKNALFMVLLFSFIIALQLMCGGVLRLPF